VVRPFAGVSTAALDPFVHMDQMGEVEYPASTPLGGRLAGMRALAHVRDADRAGCGPLSGRHCRFQIPAHDAVATNHRRCGAGQRRPLVEEREHRRNGMCQSIFSVQDDA
jgi:hypothetical protein